MSQDSAIPKRLETSRLIIISPTRAEDDESIAKLLSCDVSMKYLSAMSKKDVGGWTIADAANRREYCTAQQLSSNGWFGNVLLKNDQYVSSSNVSTLSVDNSLDIKINNESSTDIPNAQFVGTYVYTIRSAICIFFV